MSFLRWAGSKRQLLETLTHCWHAAQKLGRSGRYIEGFTGSASLFFHIKPSRALLIDINPRLIECFQRVCAAPVKISKLLNQTANCELSYYLIREMQDQNLSPNERAARFIYLNRFCFNGLYRTNSLGVFNVPYGGGKSGALPQSGDLVSAARVLEKATLAQGDFFSLIKSQVRSGDFVYLDPPYARENATLGNQYGPENFGLYDLGRLFTLADEIHKRGAYFVISYANCGEVTRYCKKWATHDVAVKRTIAANVNFRKSANEVLVTNL